MGRYDKIKVYNGTEFVKPNRIRVFDGEVWQDLGTDNSDFTKSLRVQHEGAFKRSTLNKQINTIEGDRYRDGEFIAVPSNGYCFCPVSTNAGAYTFSLELYIKRGSAGSKNIFKSYGIYMPGNYIYITLNANNTITVATSCTFDSNSNESAAHGSSKTTTNKIQDGVWNYVKILAEKGTRNVKVYIGDKLETFTGLTYSWLVYNTNRVGSTGLYIKDNGFLLKSVDGNKVSHSDNNVQANKNETRTEEVWV